MSSVKILLAFHDYDPDDDGGLRFKLKGSKWLSLREVQEHISHALAQTETLMHKGDTITVTIQTSEQEEQAK